MKTIYSVLIGKRLPDDTTLPVQSREVGFTEQVYILARTCPVHGQHWPYHFRVKAQDARFEADAPVSLDVSDLYPDFGGWLEQSVPHIAVLRTYAGTHGRGLQSGYVFGFKDEVFFLPGTEVLDVERSVFRFALRVSSLQLSAPGAPVGVWQ